MASGYNRVVMVGNLTRDPELRQLPSGQSVCRLNLASNRQFKNRQTGDMVQEVCYVDIDVWGAQADSCNQYLEKGRQVLVEGRLKLDTWQDNDGNNRSKHSLVADRVVFLSSAPSEGNEYTPKKEEETENTKLEPRNEVERELMSQLDSIKAKTTPSAPETKPAPEQNIAAAQPAVQKAPQPEPVAIESEATPSAAFKDEPPFQDDLPF